MEISREAAVVSGEEKAICVEKVDGSKETAEGVSKTLLREQLESLDGEEVCGSISTAWLQQSGRISERELTDAKTTLTLSSSCEHGESAVVTESVNCEDSRSKNPCFEDAHGFQSWSNDSHAEPGNASVLSIPWLVSPLSPHDTMKNTNTTTERKVFLHATSTNEVQTKGTDEGHYKPSKSTVTIFIPHQGIETEEPEGRNVSLQACQDEDNVAHPKLFSLFNLAWEDILFSDLLPYLSWREVFHLRRVCREAHRMVSLYSSQLKTIDLSSYGIKFTATAFQILTAECTNLRQLMLPNCIHIDDSHLKDVFMRNPHLSQVNLSGCSGLQGSCLLSMTLTCQDLVTLNLSGCQWLSCGAVDTIITHLKCLQEIDFAFCSVLSNKQFIPLSLRFPKLTRLRLAGIQSVNDATMIAVATNCRQLKHLDIQSCMGVTDAGIRSIAKHSKDLQSLRVNMCNLITEFSLKTLREQNVVIDRILPQGDVFGGLPRLHLQV